MKKVMIPAIISFVLVIGCAPAYYKLYSSPPVTQGDHATILTKSSTNAYIKDINGTKVGSGMREVIVEVPPGIVTITPTYSTETKEGRTWFTTETYPTNFNVLPGHTYLLDGRSGDEIYSDSGRYGYDSRGLYFFLTDTDTGEILYPSGYKAPDYEVKGKDYNKEIVKYNKVIKNNPNDAEAYYNRGYAYSMIEGKEKEAISDLTIAITINPNHTGAYIRRAYEYNSLGRFDEALSDYKKACDLGDELGCSNYEGLKKHLSK